MSITVTQYKAELKQEQNQEQETQNPKSLDIHIYDVVQGDGYDFWSGETIESETSAQHIRQVLSENENVENINIYINSCGGSVYEGLAIYNQLKRHKAQKTVYVDGFACSIASVIAMAGDKVIMPKSSMLMIHNAWTCAAGNAKELRKVADDLDKMSETISQAYLEKSDGKITPEELKEKLDAETYMSAEECMKYGLCDSFGDEESAEDKVKAAVQNSKKTAFMKAQVMNMFTPDVEKVLNTEDEGTCAKNAQTEAPETDVEETAAPEEGTAEPKEEAHTESVADTFMKLFINRKAV